MEEIIDAIMLLSRVRDEDIAISEVDMKDCLQHALAQLEHQFVVTNPILVVPDSMPNSLGYAPWIQIIWTNYLSNALKYGGPTPIVTISCKVLNDKQAIYSVQDNGAGVPEEKMSSLFTPFQRLDATGSGNGLGLSIVKRIIERLNGTVSVTNAENGGAIFSFTLPLFNQK